MISLGDNLSLAVDSLRAHKLRAALTVLGLTMGVATLITVMTLVQGANLYVEQKIANLGTNVFRVGRLPFALTDFSVLAKAQHNNFLYPGRYGRSSPDLPPLRRQSARPLKHRCRCATRTGRWTTPRSIGYTPNMADIDTRTCRAAAATSPNRRGSPCRVCLPDRRQGGCRISSPTANPVGHVIRAGSRRIHRYRHL